LTERGEPSRRVVLGAFLGTCFLADLSPILKLRPPSPAFAAIAGGVGEGTATALFAAFVAATLAAPPVALGFIARTKIVLSGRVARVASAVLVVAMLLAILALSHRAESLRTGGGGSDQGACIEMPARALASGHWPYDRALIWSGNACSPGLGWIVLALPFVLVAGYGSFLVAGAAALVAVPERVVGARVVTGTLLFVLSCVAAWQGLVTGADDLAIGFAFALLVALGTRAELTIPTAIGAGLVATARLPFAFFPVVLAAQIAAGGERRRGERFAVVSLATLAVAHGAPLAIRGAPYVADGPFHVLAKGARIADAGGVVFFVAGAAAWVAYAASIFRRPPSAVSLPFRMATLTLLCVGGPALADLAARLSSEALATWQGGNWLLAALPCYAASLAESLRARGASRPADTSSLRAT
jgi:hypothetical protein